MSKSLAAAASPLTRRAVIAQAWPIMVGQASVPLVGVVDTLVIGRSGTASALAGVALGAAIIDLVFWSFGFLRMGMSGLVAQAAGAGDRDEVDALLLRGMVLGLAIGALLWVLTGPIMAAGFFALPPGGAVAGPARAFVAARFYGAPAALGVFAVNGWLIGRRQTRLALVLQLIMNVINVVLDVTLVWHFGLGARGVGLGTAMAEWAALIVGLALALGPGGAQPLALIRRAGWHVLVARDKLARLVAVNRDVMIRTVALLILFTWFANAGARLGAVTLAANHVLMQFVAIAAFVLDAFALTAEERIGHAIGAGARDRFDRALRLTGEFALGGGALLAALFIAGGAWGVVAITTDPHVRATALAYLPFAAVVPLVGAPSWLLDGVFIGATDGRALRNAAVVSTLGYLACDYALRPLGDTGVWLALLLSYGFRAGTLAWRLPALRARLASAVHP
ncbi:MATE family efflux transporter [Novosphingobium sp. FSW06-99]|uniref:MATE family efflux transporter n=1 Tax=Novosphingobium sp. FSW06-99 TaxID=1739113 RepID=UPI000A96F84C|nr:MATE family efflux transporter [Novosphingobium sp. FSW06-99]